VWDKSSKKEKISKKKYKGIRKKGVRNKREGKETSFNTRTRTSKKNQEKPPNSRNRKGLKEKAQEKGLARGGGAKEKGKKAKTVKNSIKRMTNEGRATSGRLDTKRNRRELKKTDKGGRPFRKNALGAVESSGGEMKSLSGHD